MRMMQYELKLFERGYVVTSGPMHGYDKVQGHECLPIKITILKCRDECCADTDIVNLVSGDASWGTKERPISTSCREALGSEDSDWYLYSFEVSNSSLILDFYNPEEDCSDYIMFDEAWGKAFILKVQLDVPRKDDGPGSRYIVELSSTTCQAEELQIAHSTAKVIEYHKDIRRELEFEKDHRVFITEYAEV